LLYKLKILPNSKAKEVYLKFFFHSIQINQFNQKANDFCERVLPGIIRPRALEEISNYKKSENVDILIATASAINWVKPWSDKMEIECIGTELQVINDKITGNILGNNCYGKSKFDAVVTKYRFSDYDEIHFYGDSAGDKVFEKAVDKFYYRYFSWIL
jgi:phosphoserine phosphatase